MPKYIWLLSFLNKPHSEISYCLGGIIFETVPIIHAADTHSPKYAISYSKLSIAKHEIADKQTNRHEFQTDKKILSCPSHHMMIVDCSMRAHVD